ncbi:hypothetical protein [Spiroplasma culicicola]|uniref:Transmembrane protein n=1 Tax=Spiroplasma culicicola AES-1 TaxID=1276246 RepID=W6A7F3_9MOLU|nr:hypothetical protein [Spiroplasma culicicola]AHI53073.1 hypothetical protein SCULI_v1c07320 [Spiroplasma culicicola AES-1]
MARKRPSLTDKLVNGKMGDMYTKRFLKSQHVNMVSEGDFLTRVRSLCFATYLIPFQVVWIAFYLYARIMVGIERNNPNAIINPDEYYLLSDQITILNVFLAIQIYHVFLLSTILIVMLNMTMGKGITIYTIFFNFLFISEALLYASLIFILDWVGILHKFKDWSYFFEMLRTQWLWILAIFIAYRSFKPLITIFKNVNNWNREWIRIDRYRKTEDKENAFVFKTWVTPGETRARTGMIVAGWFAIITASVFELLDVFINTEFTVMKYLILIFGYIVFLGAYIVPYNKYSLFFYWINHAFLFGLTVYGLVLVQNQAWYWPNFYMYAYLVLLIPWAISLKASIRYTWTLKDKEEIKAVVLNMFESQDEFEQYLEQRDENKKDAETSI